MTKSDIPTCLTAEKLRREMLERSLSAHDLAILMRYSWKYVASVARGNLPVTREFESRFEEVLSDDRLWKLVHSYVQKDAPVDRPLYVLKRPRKCRCGCGKVFVPTTWNNWWMPGHRR